MEGKGSAEPRAKYVWDRDKLAWVEATEEPAVEEPSSGEGVAEATYEEGLEEIPAEVSAIEGAGVEGLQYRGAWIRLGGTVIDGVIIAIINLAFRTALGTESTVVTWLVPIIGAVYFIGFWAWRGQTLGKMVIGARIVRRDGSPIGLARAILRYAGYFVYFLVMRIGGAVYVPYIILLVGFLIIAFSREKRGLHDLIAGTVVINTRPKPLEDYEEEEEYGEAYEEEEEVEASEETWDTSQG
jgi:uncharacterized RDD family membrane protein YckC